MSKKESTVISENRNSERTFTELRTIVRGQTEDGETWKEITNVSTVSQNGASFKLTRPCQVGCLLKLVLPMPTELRAYDLTKDLYPVMGLIQYCEEITIDDHTEYSIGIAFVGKQIPDSYQTNPMQSYHICGTTESGMWKIAEADTPFKARAAARFWISLEVTISMIQKEKRANYKEVTVTNNISATGASVRCSLEVNVGDRVKFASKEHNFYTIAVVRNRNEDSDKTPTLHIEFINDRFPIEKIPVSQTVDVTV